MLDNTFEVKQPRLVGICTECQIAPVAVPGKSHPLFKARIRFIQRGYKCISQAVKIANSTATVDIWNSLNNHFTVGVGSKINCGLNKGIVLIEKKIGEEIPLTDRRGRELENEIKPINSKCKVKVKFLKRWADIAIGTVRDMGAPKVWELIDKKICQEV